MPLGITEEHEASQAPVIGGRGCGLGRSPIRSSRAQVVVLEDEMPSGPPWHLVQG